MADSTITALTAKNTPIDADLLVIVDTTVPDNKKLTIGNLKAHLHASPIFTAPTLNTVASGDISACTGSPTLTNLHVTTIHTSGDKLVTGVVNTDNISTGDEGDVSIQNVSGVAALSVAVATDTVKYAPLITSPTPTGTGAMVLASHPSIEHPTFTTPVLGTPASGDLTNCRLHNETAEATYNGSLGQIYFDSDYIYVCVGTNSWRRAALEVIPG